MKMFSSHVMLTLIIGLLMFANKAMAQNNEDQKKMLEICFQAPEIEGYLKDIQKDIVVLQHGVNFQFPSDVYFSGRKVHFIGKEEFRQKNITTYFLFWRFDVIGNSAKVDYSYIIDERETIMFELELVKSNDNWMVSTSKNERKSL